MQLTLLLVTSILLSGLTSAQQESDAVDSSAEIDQQWKNFKVKFGKSYATAAEETSRKKIFVGTLKEIEAHNALYSKGLTSYTTGINQFSDLEDREFIKKVNCQILTDVANGTCDISNTLPEKRNWTAEGHVQPVEDQGDCGACWAFAATGALEALMFRTTQKSVPLSKQDLIDCSSEDPYGNKGCGGGNPDRAFQYVKDKKGINSNESYPYAAQKLTCRHDASDIAGMCDSYHVIYGDDCIQDFVAHTGPIAVNMVAPPSFKSYSGGIYDNPKACTGGANHSALIVGYGWNSSINQTYWIVKNSWGITWGEYGYANIVKGTCGIGHFATYPIRNDSTSSYKSASVMYILLMRLFIIFFTIE